MSAKQPNPSLVELRAIAEERVTTWRTLAADEQTKRAEAEALYKNRPVPNGTYQHGRLVRASTVVFEHLTAQLAVSEAAERAAVAEREACMALDALELAENDAAARARHLPSVRDDLVDTAAKLAEHEAAIVALKRHATERVQGVLGADATVAARRHAANLPFVSAGFAPAFGRSYLASVDEALSRGIPLPGHAVTVRDLRAQITGVAADLEIERKEREAKAKDEARVQRSNAFIEEQDRKRERARHEADCQEAAADVQRREQLAADYLARHTSGATS